MQCEEWADANSELFKEAHDETVHKNSYKRKLYELISASLGPWQGKALLPCYDRQGGSPARKWHDSAGSRAAASWHKQEIEDL